MERFAIVAGAERGLARIAAWADAADAKRERTRRLREDFEAAERARAASLAAGDAAEADRLGWERTIIYEQLVRAEADVAAFAAAPLLPAALAHPQARASTQRDGRRP